MICAIMQISTKLLKEEPLFEGSSEDGLEKILEICSEKKYKEGETIFSKGDKAEIFGSNKF